MVTKEDAVRIADSYCGVHSSAQSSYLVGIERVSDDWPEGRTPYLSRPITERFWVVWIPDRVIRVGAARYVAVSQETGEILLDEYLGE